jgi:hypothetical protein
MKKIFIIAAIVLTIGIGINLWNKATCDGMQCYLVEIQCPIFLTGTIGIPLPCQLLPVNAFAGEKEDLSTKQELLMWKSRAIQCETPAVLKDMQAEFAANAAKLKELEAKEKKEKKAETGKK